MGAWLRRWWIILLGICVAIILAGLLLFAPRAAGAAVASAAAFDHGHGALAQVLKSHVKSGWVAYGALAKDRKGLDRYNKSLAAVSPEQEEGFTRPQRLAFWLNAYNALTLQLIIDKRPAKSIRDIDKPWDKPKFVVARRKLSLNAIEHEIIRAQFKDPRAHAAMVCAAKSCPVLQSQPYQGSKLDAQLDAASRQWVTDATRNRFLADDNTLWVSKIFDWFGDDFVERFATLGNGDSDGGATKRLLGNARKPSKLAATRGFVAHYSGYAISASTKVQYLPYDWALNGSW